MAMMAETSDGTVWMAGVEEMTSFCPATLLEHQMEDTYISPPRRWWQHWWVAFLSVFLLSIIIWGTTRWIEKRRNRQRMINLERAKLEKERKINAIRQKAIEAEPGELAKDIVKMTETTEDTRFTIRTINGIVITDISDIAYFKADGNYTQMVTFQKKETILTGIGKLEKRLNPQTFVRADRSTLVNIHNISYLNAKQHICTFKSADNIEVETVLLTPAFKRLESMLYEKPF